MDLSNTVYFFNLILNCSDSKWETKPEMSESNRTQEVYKKYEKKKKKIHLSNSIFSIWVL